MPTESRRLFRGVLLIVSSLMRRRFPGANDSRPRLPLREAHHQKTLARRVPDDQLAPFALRMIRIIENVGERIGKYCQGLFEGDPMFLEIFCCLLRVPLELRSHRL